ncbi:hypothetical protein DPMN_099577 [Dreissena polymorpha]|uniref:Uncharacterized protein n=1 Tax=Dreissena polymorpha TaxID=45954 RepID=A0A9D4R8B0_DREPO|nr:hypothetical protein DPMN_099577 [Dreissena polymorpha]
MGTDNKDQLSILLSKVMEDIGVTDELVNFRSTRQGWPEKLLDEEGRVLLSNKNLRISSVENVYNYYRTFTDVRPRHCTDEDIHTYENATEAVP